MGRSGWACAVCGDRYDADVLFCPRDGAPIAPPGIGSPGTADPYLGRRLAGGVRLERLLGIGTMGRVYEAMEPGLDRRVAVKILHPELAANASVTARFEREARIVGRLVHPHLVRVFSSGTIALDPPPGARGEAVSTPYIVMEYIDGISLRSALSASRGFLPPARAIRVVAQAASAVGEAHRHGIVHRDLKPENLLLARTNPRNPMIDEVKVVDFGLARLLRPQGPVTEAGLMFGTAQYMSPEGAAGEPVGPPADVYALATILYESLVGRLPFEGDKAIDVMLSKVDRDPRPIAEYDAAASLPAPLADLVMRNLARRPEHRARDAAAFARDLLAIERCGGVEPAVVAAPVATARLGSGVMPGRAAEEHRPAAAVAADSVHSPRLPGEPMGVASKNHAPAAAPPAVPMPVSRGVFPRRAGPALAIVLCCLTGGALLAALVARRGAAAHRREVPIRRISVSARMPQAAAAAAPATGAQATAAPGLATSAAATSAVADP